MQDNIVYRLELTNEEYEFIENLRNELYDKISKRYPLLGNTL